MDQKKVTAVDTGRKVEINQTVRRKREEEAPRAPRRFEAKEPEPQKKNPEPAAQEQAQEPQKEWTPSYVESVEFDESGDFAAMLAESEAKPQQSFKIGDKVQGEVVHVGKDHIFIALGPKLEAAIASAEFSEQPNLGSQISAYVISTYGGVTLSKTIAQSGLDDAMLEEALAKRIPVEGKVTGVNKGGFDVMVSGKRAFCPVGQIDLRFVEDTASYVGKNLTFLVERVEEKGRNIVVSRKALLAREQKEKAEALVKELEVGKKYKAVITRVADFGAFADIGGLEGLIPRSEIAHGHIDRVSDVVSTNDQVEVVVLSFEPNSADITKSRLSFSLKQAKADPYTLHWDAIKEGATLEGRVVRIESFGAFVELFPGIDGLIHISELAESRVTHPKDVLSVGDPVSVRVLSANSDDRRIALSLREAVSKKAKTEPTSMLERGQKASGVVSRIERYGVFLELENGATALLPQPETGLPKNTDLSRAFSIGETVLVAVIDVDMQNRIRVSSLARKQMEERDSYVQYKSEETERSKSFGSFADLINKHKH